MAQVNRELKSQFTSSTLDVLRHAGDLRVRVSMLRQRRDLHCAATDIVPARSPGWVNPTKAL